MSICKTCGKSHELVLENRETGECEALDICYECFFEKGYTYSPIKDVDTFNDWGIELRRTEDKLIEQMMKGCS